MGSTFSRPSSSVAGPTGPEPLNDRSRAEFTLDDIYNPRNTCRAQNLHRTDHDRFCKYRNYFKNHHMALAKAVGRQANTSKRLGVLQWVERAVGPLKGGEKLTKDELLEVAMVSAALTEYGAAKLSKLYDRGELDALPNVPLYTRHLRLPAKQQACRNGSDAINKHKREAAHYIGLEVMLRLNERLPVDERMGDDLRVILNHPTNLRLVLATSNQTLHKQVDALLINATDPVVATGHRNGQRPTLSVRVYDRLVQIAKHAQDDVFQDAMIAAKGHALYRSLRRQFLRLTSHEQGMLWNVAKDKAELRDSRASFVPHNIRGSQSPAKKPAPTCRMIATAIPSKTKPPRPFSRRVAHWFSSRSKPKHALVVRRAVSPPTSASHATDTTITQRVAKAKPRKLPRVIVATTKQEKATRPRRPGKRQPRTASTKIAPNALSSSIPDARSDEHDSDDLGVDSDLDTLEARVVHIGPRGGKYFMNAAGKKVYVKFDTYEH